MSFRCAVPMTWPEPLVGNVIDVQFSATHRRPGLDRSFFSSASCGVCGKRSIESLEIKAARAGVGDQGSARRADLASTAG